MKKVYILFYSNSLGTREEVRDYLDSLSEVLHWRYDIPNVFYLISEENAETLATNQSDFFNFWKTGAILH